MKTTPAPRKFNSRAFSAMMTVFSAIGLAVSGIFNHVYGFAPLTVERHAWMSAHNSLALLFVVFATWHVVLNRRALAAHARNAVLGFPAISREAILAAAVTALVLLVFVGHAFHAGA